MHHPLATPALFQDHSTASLIRRLWRDHVRHYRGRIVLIVVMTLVMSGTTALYPALIDWAFTMFARKDPRILYQVPVLVLVVTVIKGLSMYFQSVLTQDMVLLVIRRLQVGDVRASLQRRAWPASSARRRRRWRRASPPTPR